MAGCNSARTTEIIQQQNSVIGSDLLSVFRSRLKHSYLLSPLTSTLSDASASEVTTLWCFTNVFIIFVAVGSKDPEG